eukprot:gene29714-18553_t
MAPAGGRSNRRGRLCFLFCPLCEFTRPPAQLAARPGAEREE